MQQNRRIFAGCYRITSITADCIKYLAALQKTYGPEWCLQLLSIWASSKNYSWSASGNLIKQFNAIVLQAKQFSINSRIVDFLLHYQWKAILSNDKNNKKNLPLVIQESDSPRKAIMLDFIEGCFIVENTIELMKDCIAHLTSNSDTYILPDLAEIYFCIAPQLEHKYPSVHASFTHYISKEITTELSAGLRDPQDWSIRLNLGCVCDLCKTTRSFLHSTSESIKIWPIAQQSRDYVTNKLTRFPLPLTIDVEKRGSPHKLVLTKTKKLYELAQTRYNFLLKYAELLGTKEELDIEPGMSEAAKKVLFGQDKNSVK